MRRSILDTGPKQNGSVAVSIIANAVLIALIASITFTYPPSAFFEGDRTKTPTERVTYVQVQPRGSATAGNGAVPKAKPKKVATPVPEPIFAPSVIPTTLPPIPAPTPSVGATSGTATGTGGAPGGAPAGVATGIEPAMPDPRIELKPNSLRLPLSMSQKNDSAVKAIYMAYRQAEIAAEENRGRSPRDWTIERNGQKYGVDSQYIYLGKFKVPSAILAALPFNYGGVDGARIIQARNANWIRDDIMSHSQGMSEDDFRAAIKRIRERKDRERKESEKAATKASPIVP
jgi:hypothetical protein